MEAAELTDLLRQDGGFTLFAPSDKAFAALTERDVNMLKGLSAVMTEAVEKSHKSFNKYYFAVVYFRRHERSQDNSSIPFK